MLLKSYPMNLLSLTSRLRQCFSIALVLLICSSVSASDHKPDSLFAEHVTAADAYMLYAFTDVVYTQSWRASRRHTTIESKIVINNRAGVEQYAFLNLDNDFTNKLESISIKTLKADGSVVELDSSLVFRHQPEEGPMGQVNYPVPGVEPGDTIEIFITFVERLQANELGDFIFLHNELPSLRSEYSITVPPHLEINYKLYNDFPEPQVTVADTLIHCLFKEESIRGITAGQYSCPSCELAYVYYKILDEGEEMKSWKDAYNIDFNIISQPMMVVRRNSSHYRRWKRRVLREARHGTKYDHLELLLTDIRENFSMEPPAMNEAFMSSGYYIRNGRLDPVSIRRLYRQILEDLEIDYWAVFARSKRKGSIDPDFMRSSESDHLFFAYEDEKGSLQLIYPHEYFYRFQKGEIPTSLYNTQAVIVKPYRTGEISRRDRFIRRDFNLAEADSVITDLIKLPGMDASLNHLRQIYYCDVDINDQHTSFNAIISLSGGLSTDIRGFLAILQQDQEASDFFDALSEYEGQDHPMKVDTVTSFDLRNHRPFVFTINAEGTVQSGITFINDSIVSITLDNLVQHNQVESDEDSIDLNYYLDYSYSDQQIFVINFPCSMEIMGSEDYSRSLENEYGKYAFTIQTVNSNQLTIHSSYSITRDVIPKEDYHQLRELNDFLREATNQRILVKLKEN